MDTFDHALLKSELTLDEGRDRDPYMDSRGHLTAGIGRNIGAKGFSDSEIDLMFANDVAECCAALDLHVAWWRTLSPGKQRVMIGLVFNMGWPVFSQFHQFLAAMQARDWTVAAAELKDSLWYRQVRDRGPRVVARLLAADAAPMA